MPFPESMRKRQLADLIVWTVILCPFQLLRGLVENSTLMTGPLGLVWQLTPSTQLVGKTVIAMLQLHRAALVLIVTLLIGFCTASSGFAQGLKLGEPDTTQPNNSTLDLGASPSQKPAANSTTQPLAPRGGELIRTNFKSWEVACLADNTNCAMAQIGKDSTGNPVLEMVIRKLPEPLEAGGEIAIAVLDVITPLGVVLTEGLALKIDSGKDAVAPFQVCTEQGCLVREPVAEDLISRLKKGSNASVTVVAANQGVVTTQISLSGFTAAYDTLR